MSKLTKLHAHQATPYRGKARKEGIVAEFTDKVKKAKGMVFTNYQGLTHKQTESLKKAVKKLEAEYVITKNRLVLRALESANLSDEDKKHFEQPTATLFIYNDIVEPLKQLSKAIKQFKLPLIKFGLLEGKSLTEADVVKLATLPSMPVLRAQLLGQMQAPIQGLHRALNWNLQSLVITLNAIVQKKQV